MAELTITDVREQVETDLNDAALTRVLAAAVADVVNLYGPAVDAGDVTEQHLASEISRDGSLLFPRRAIGTVTSVTEHVGSPNSETSTVLAANDYRVRDGGLLVDRLSGGTNSRSTWGDRVTLIHTPADGDAARNLVLIDLCKLTVQYDGLASAAIGGQSVTIGDYEQQRAAILRRLQRVPKIR